MIAGVLAALLAVLFARIVVEPRIDQAIAFEAAASAARGEGEGPEIVSRTTQRGAGLLTATVAYGAAFGGLFALAFAALHGRALTGTPRGAAMWLAVAAFVVLCLAPQLKFPPNPPAVGQHMTIQLRTAAYFGMMALSLAAATGTLALSRALERRLTVFNARAAGFICFAVVCDAVALALPRIDEVPVTFPASLLWQFRLGSLATQALLWAAIGLIFGKLAERLLSEHR
jgi:predicted cobalt transporter CbtA